MASKLGAIYVCRIMIYGIASWLKIILSLSHEKWCSFFFFFGIPSERIPIWRKIMACIDNERIAYLRFCIKSWFLFLFFFFFFVTLQSLSLYFYVRIASLRNITRPFSIWKQWTLMKVDRFSLAIIINHSSHSTSSFSSNTIWSLPEQPLTKRWIKWNYRIREFFFPPKIA